MSTLIDVVEGVSNAVLSYFFDPKEPVLQLKPLYDEKITHGLVAQLALELTAKNKAYQLRVKPKAIEFFTTEGHYGFMEASDIESSQPFYKTWKASQANPDELHKANMSTLWHLAQTLKKGKGKSEVNFHHAAEMVVALADSNRGRLINLSIDRHADLIRFSAVFEGRRTEGFDSDLYTVVFHSDNHYWDLDDYNPNKASVPFIVNSFYDDTGRLTQVNRVALSNPKELMGVVQVQYLDNNPFPNKELMPVVYTLIPSLVIDVLDLFTVTGYKDTVCSTTCNRFHTYNCVTRDGRSVVVTIIH